MAKDVWVNTRVTYKHDANDHKNAQKYSKEC